MPSPVERQALPTNLDKERHRLLGEELANDNLVQLNAAGEAFYCLWNHTTTGNALGAVLILHEEGHHLDWPLTINSLRVELADHGWSTLTVDLPNPTAGKISLRPTPIPTPIPESNAEPKPNPEAAIDSADNKEPPQSDKPEPENPADASAAQTKPEIETVVGARLNAALDYLHGAGQFNIVILGQGLGAARAAVFINQLMTSSANSAVAQNTGKAKAIIKRPVRALVLVNARNHIAGSELTLPQQLKDPGLPVLDIVFGDHYMDSHEAEKRRRWASRQQMSNYSQVKTRRPVGGASEKNNRLVKRVRGFLNRNAKGVEIGK